MLTLLLSVVFKLDINSLSYNILIIVFSVLCYYISFVTQYDSKSIARNFAISNTYLDGINSGNPTIKFLNNLLYKNSIIGGIMTAGIFIISPFMLNTIILNIASLFIYVTILNKIIITVKSLNRIENYEGFLFKESI